ncbi:MAG: FtsQ-type POTRA domain-containing protein [Actinomycetota bacterium]|nr:FtsQ-type POTRA domain-containing protein [Actinomycetota bacterium]
MTAPTGERRLGVDPRLRARRQDVLRQKGRQRLRRVQAGGAVVVAGGLAWAAVMSPLLDVDRVIVRGVDASRAVGVERAAAVEVGSPLATLDPDRVRAATEAVAWVHTATVSRSLPGTVLISVSERTPVAGARLLGGGWVLVDHDRQLAVVDDDELGGLPRVVNALAQARPGAGLDDTTSAALELAGRLDGVIGPDADGVGGTGAPEIVVGEDGALDVALTLDGSEVQVRFGRPIDLEHKVRALAALLESGVVVDGASGGDGEPLPERGGVGSPRHPVVIDVRVPEAPVMRQTGP